MKLLTMTQLKLAFLIALIPLCKPVQAQSEMESGPAVVVSVTNLDEQFSDIKHVMEKSGFGDFAFFIDAATSEYVRGIDKTQAACISLFFRDGEQEPKVVGFIPVSNLDDVLDTVADYADIEEDGDKIVLIADDGTEFQVKETDGYAVVSNDDELFDDAPTSPASMLGDLPNNYNLSFKVFAQRIPADMRDMAIDMIAQGFEESMGELGDDSMTQEEMDAQIEQIEGMINDADELLIGLNIDEDKGSVNFDISITGLPDSKFARSAAEGKKAETKFAGFIDKNAAITAHGCSKILEEDIPAVKSQVLGMSEAMLDQIFSESDMSDEDAEFVEETVTEMFELFANTIEEGSFDFGLAAFIDEENFDIAAGGLCSDTMRFDELVRKTVDHLKAKAEEDGVEFSVAYNDSNHSGVDFHKVTIGVPEYEAELREIIGDTITAVIGIGDNVTYMGVGRDPKSVVTNAIDKSKAGAPADTPAGQVIISLTPILKFAYEIQQDDALLELAENLEESGNDKIVVISKFIENGQFMRFEVQEGLFQLGQVLGQQFGGGGGFGDEDF